MNIYWFIGSRSNIYIFNMARHAPLPLMYVAGHSSSGWNRLQHSLAPPASQPPSRSVCVFISTCLNYAKAPWQKTLTLARNKLVPCWRCRRILFFSEVLVIETLDCMITEEIGNVIFCIKRFPLWEKTRGGFVHLLENWNQDGEICDYSFPSSQAWRQN